MKKEIEICDICGNSIAKKKCEVCGKDFCNNCGTEWKIKLSYHDGCLIDMCKGCANTKLDKEVLEKIKEDIIKNLKKGKIIQNLKEEKNETNPLDR